MERRAVVRLLRGLRKRRGLSQEQLGSLIGISRSEMSRWERGALDACSVKEVEGWATALSAHLVIELRIDGERPLADARHAAIQNWVIQLLRDAGWIAEAEVSFNHYGDRGRIDVLAYHPALRLLLVIEVKTRIDDAQDVIGRLDVKRRIAATLARDRGWRITTMTPALLMIEGRTARRRIATHEALFAPFELRARGAIAWMKRPTVPPPPGILAFVSVP